MGPSPRCASASSTFRLTAHFWYVNLSSLSSGARPMTPVTPAVPRLLDRVRDACRLRHYSPRTEAAYWHWIIRFIRHHSLRHPLEMGAAEINQFLTHLAVDGHVSASTQNQAFNAHLSLPASPAC